LSPFPGAFTGFEGRLFKIYRSEVKQGAPSSAPGAYETDNKSWLRFAAADGYLYAKEIQAEGKKKMGIGEFLKGFKPRKTTF
jgi:methionyl-tRNA formyltransferase